MTVWEIMPAGDFGGHEFEYQSTDDLFKCVHCGKYEVVLRDRETGAIPPCQPQQNAEKP